ncbi:hypothetical protein I6L80_15775 [Providencia rettgeri]|uniref:Uncharacterized protein n=1 Tax=Providencia rettgeri TaxID=587 RepID=A0A379FTW9_PRORE|nr:hypothetical protein [Providencia rettgeri]QXB04821.1 hypothetical protein I6L80_15775 [Providencia rettgeri]SUC32131.1 Uncharacterised protein [Providencia rettgeri]
MLFACLRLPLRFGFGFGLILILCSGGAFLAGWALNVAPRYPLHSVVERSVKDIMEYPEAASYRNMNTYFAGYTRDDGKIVYVCGEVFRFNDERPDDYKPFVVKAYISEQDIVTLSMPVIAFGNDIFTTEQVQKVWGLRCHPHTNMEESLLRINDGVYLNPIDDR